MKNVNSMLRLVIVFSMIHQLSSAQNSGIISDYCYGGSMDDYLVRLKDIQGIQNINLIAPGYTGSSNGTISGNAGANDAWLLGVDNSYSVVISETTGGNQNEYATDCVADLVNGIAVIGQGFSSQLGNHGGGDILLYTRDNNGNTINQKYIGGTLEDRGVRLLFDAASSRYIALANIKSTDGDISGLTHHGQSDIGVFELDLSYNITNSFLIGSSGFDIVKDAYLDNNDLYIMGETDGNNFDFSGTTANGSDDIFVKKYNTLNWTVQATYRYGGNDTDHGNKFIFEPGSGFTITGSTRSTNYGGCFLGQTNGIVINCNLSGQTNWVKCIEGSDDDILVAGTYSPAYPNVYFVSGYSLSVDGHFNVPGFGNWDCFMAALDENNSGSLLWLKKYGGSGIDIADDMLQPASGPIVTLNHTNSTDGNVTSFNHGLFEAWIVVPDNPTALNNVQPGVTSLMVYPNPANNFITVHVPGLPSANVKYEVTDLTGKAVANGKETGNTFTIPVHQIAKGYYLIRVSCDSGQWLDRFTVER
ncbi:MAG TPA: T9SS type A sorting domain-containing protein [Bacteroidia bacterium]|nr:T9SS type A sorting domain-containing protein [Bacteroidia bacterium]